ncbi:hypothetical protein PUMCH_003451 [Australozyma saopauloensis]|uniref:Nitrogen permease regulator 3 n=1 Tax=Australozyma saopauloensis TaxID=291208 RepID=A0AAX4HCK5_9ASCO|nr:hypothetical protein PUMCH_003451 [[Candida] saopauloensis]
MSYNLPNPSLVGLLLAVSTHNGPQIVYHYPPELGNQKLLLLNPDEEAANDDDFDDEDYVEDDSKSMSSETSATNDVGAKFLDKSSDLAGVDADAGSTKLKKLNSATTEDFKSRKETDSSTKGQILGFEPEILAEMLSPPREMCNCRFDIMLESMVFLGLPIHAQPDGSWRPQKARSFRTAARSESVGHGVSAGGSVGHRGSVDDTIDEEPSEPKSQSALSMFNLVFVMNPPKIERSYRTDEMFYYVILKLMFILRYEQHKRNYMWEQVKLISHLKEEFAATPPEDRDYSLSSYLLSGLLLCKMMNHCFASLVASRVAHLNINNKLHSFQIPLKMEFHSLPEVSTPYVPGSYLSSTASFLGETGLVAIGETVRYSGSSLIDQVLGTDIADEQEDDLDEDEYLTSSDELLHLGLLLWDDPETIIKEIKAKSSSPIATFIRMIRPTESLLKVYSRLEENYEGRNDLNISSVREFALHLVHWRKARMIPPLNTRGIYIISPMAPIGSRFKRDIAKFNLHFPTIPSLPLFLKSLSTRSKKPRQFATIIPSKDHKDIYLLALAWLVRYGYATQLHTYIWLKVSRKIKMKVEEELEMELGKVLKRGSKSYQNNSEASVTENKIQTAVDNSSKQAGAASAETIEDEIDKLQRRLENAQNAPDIVMEDDSDTILVDPGRASNMERRWINQIIHKECELSPELTAVFYKLLKYMNGRNSLELLLLKENITRAELRKLLLSIESHVISVRHW